MEKTKRNKVYNLDKEKPGFILALAGRGGFEPPLANPESAVLPLDDLPER